MSYIGQTLPADTFQGFTTDSFTGDGSATTFTLSKAPFSENGLIVVINNVIQKPTTNFTVSGTTLTIVGAAVASGDVIYATHLSGVIPSTLASKLDTNGVSDADTTVDGFLAHEVSSIVPEAISGDKDETETKTKVVVNSSGFVIRQDVEEADWIAGKVADEDGNTEYPTDSTWEASKVVPVYQGIDQSKLVPLMVKTIQELEARIKTLEDA